MEIEWHPNGIYQEETPERKRKMILNTYRAENGVSFPWKNALEENSRCSNRKRCTAEFKDNRGIHFVFRRGSVFSVGFILKVDVWMFGERYWKWIKQKNVMVLFLFEYSYSFLRSLVFVERFSSE